MQPTQKAARLISGVIWLILIVLRFYPDGGHGISDPNTGKLQDEFLNDLTEFIENAGH